MYKTERLIATVGKAIEDLQDYGTSYATLKTLFTEETLALLQKPVFECRECREYVAFDELVNTDEADIDEIVYGYCTCSACYEKLYRAE